MGIFRRFRVSGKKMNGFCTLILVEHGMALGSGFFRVVVGFPKGKECKFRDN